MDFEQIIPQCLQLLNWFTNKIFNRQEMYTIYIDLSKAFDTLNFDILL